MSNNEKICLHCGAKVAPAMVRCRECGQQIATPAANQAKASGIFRNVAENRPKPASENALSMDDMLSFAEDAESNASSVFQISRSINPVKSASQELDLDVPDSVDDLPIANTPAQPTPQTRSRPTTPSKSNASSDTNKPSNRSSVVSSVPLESPSAVRKRRERGKKTEDSGSQRLQLAIRKAIKISGPEDGLLLSESERPEPAVQKQQSKQWPKTIKQQRKILEDNYDEHGRAAVNSLCDALEAIGEIQREEAVEILSGYLGDARPAVRETAARALGETRLASAFEPLVKKLLHESSDMRAAVVAGLGTLGDRRAIGPLLTLAGEDPQFGIRAADALVKLGVNAVPLLVELAEESEPAEMLTALMALGRLKDSRALEVLAHKSSHPMATVRSHAIEAIGQLGESKGVRFLVKGLSDDNVGVRIQAAIGLRKMADRRASDALVQALNDPDQDVQEQVIAALGTCGDDSAAMALVPLLESPHTEICIATAEALGKLGNDKAVPKLCELLNRPEITENRVVLMKILDALRRLKNPIAMMQMVDLLAHPTPEIREKAVDVLGQIGDNAAVVDVENVLKQDKSETVRAAAARALGEIGDPESIEALEEGLTDAVQVKLKAVMAMGKIANPNAMLSLTAMLRDQLPELRYHASQALAEIGDQRSIRPIEVLAADPDPMVSRGAFKALQKLGDTRPEKQILKAAKKRAKKSTSTKASASNLKDMFSPAVLKDIFWPDDPQKRVTILGSIGGVLVVGLIAAFFMIDLTPNEIVLRGFPSHVSLSPSGKKLVTARSYGLVEIWDINGSRPSDDFGHKPGLIFVCMTGDNTFWAATFEEILKFEGSKGTPIAKIQQEIVRIDSSQDRSRVAFFDSDGNVYVYDTQTNAALGSLAFPGIKSITFSEKGELFAVTVGNTVKVFDLNSTELQSIDISSPVVSMAFSADDQRLAILMQKDQELVVYQLSDGQILGSTKGAGYGRPTAVEFGDDLQVVYLFASGLYDQGGIFKWSIDQPAPIVLEGSTQKNPISYNRQAGLIASREDEESAIYIYDINAKTETTLDYHQ